MLPLREGSTSINDEKMNSIKTSYSSINKSNTFSTAFINPSKNALPDFTKNSKFEWKNLNVFIGTNKNNTQILHHINGSIRSGQLLAVIGSSGAGKSTLLNALSGRTNLTEQKISGELFINGNKINVQQQKIIKSVCTYIPQSDILCPTQTVKEALIFYSKLKLSYLSKDQQMKRMNHLIRLLKLNQCVDNYIGDDSKRGISGGEKRRVTIASEMLNEKSIILLDEPTSGLDSYTAKRTIQTLKQFCNISNAMVIATIHQPSIEVFYLFDKLILLSKGYCCFNSNISNIDIFFRKSLKPKTNPADVIVYEIQKYHDKYIKKWQQSKLNDSLSIPSTLNDFDNNDRNISGFFNSFALESVSEDTDNGTRNAPILLQFKLLLHRELKALIRNYRLTILRILQVVFFSCVCGLIYLNVAEDFDTRVECLIMLTLVVLLFGVVSIVTVFPKQRLLFQREYNSKTYSIIPWILSFMLVEIPREIVHMALFTLIAHHLINLNGNCFEYWLTLFLTSFSGGSLGILFGAISKTTVEAAQLVPVGFIPVIIFSGGIISVNHIPSFLRWICDLNPLYYILRCCCIIEFYGAEYARSLSPEEESICCTLREYNKTNIKNYWYQLNNDAFRFDIMNDSCWNNGTSGNSTNSNSTNHEEPQFCMTEISYTKVFSRFNVNAHDDLTCYWILILIICVVLRLVGILIVLIVNHNGFSWILKKAKSLLNCL